MKESSDGNCHDVRQAAHQYGRLYCGASRYRAVTQLAIVVPSPGQDCSVRLQDQGMPAIGDSHHPRQAAELCRRIVGEVIAPAEDTPHGALTAAPVVRVGGQRGGEDQGEHERRPSQSRDDACRRIRWGKVGGTTQRRFHGVLLPRMDGRLTRDARPDLAAGHREPDVTEKTKAAKARETTARRRPDPRRHESCGACTRHEPPPSVVRASTHGNGASVNETHGADQADRSVQPHPRWRARCPELRAQRGSSR